MASVWAQDRKDRRPQKVRGHLSPHHAVELARRIAREWKGPVIRVFDYEWLFYETEADFLKRKVAGSLYVEFLSPPSSPEPGQAFRPTAKAGGGSGASR